MRLCCQLIWLSSVGALLIALCPHAHASILPPNTLSLEDNLFDDSVMMTTKSPNSNPRLTLANVQPIFEALRQIYNPLAQTFGATFDVQFNRESSEVSAFATRQKDSWVVIVYGGFVRRPEMTTDALALALCHEVGHLFGGYPFVSNDNLASEGQADYFATHVCAPALWKHQPGLNAAHRKKTTAIEQQQCDNAWPADIAMRNLCYRITFATKPLMQIIALATGEPQPSFETPSTQVAEHTVFDDYPNLQCRLDTFLQGALCNTAQDPRVIPGFVAREILNGSLNTIESERESRKGSCYDILQGSRPSCWFKPLEGDSVPPKVASSF